VFDPARVSGLDVRARYDLDGRFVVGWAGILRRWHGFGVLLDALRDAPAAHLLLVGDGPDRAHVEQLARERGLSGRFTITGRIPHDAMPAHLAAVDVAVAAEDHTGFASPMKIVEYMAMARPTLVPRRRNFEDLVEHDRTGLFFRPGDSSDLARHLRTLEASPALRDRLGHAARAAVEQRFNWRHNALAVTDALAAH
jgi:glycosyltransferase involved in cell wall biosynthesis